MPFFTHPLTLQVQEIFTESDLAPEVTRLLLDELNSYFVRHTITYSENLPAIVETLYAIADQKMYTIVSVCDFHGYKAVLLPPLQHLIKDSSKETITRLKMSGKYEGVSLHAEIMKVNTLLKHVLELLRSSTRSTRKAIGLEGKEVEFPDDETLKIFYECGRKVSYDSKEHAESNVTSENALYRCRHCNKFHQGRKKAVTAPPVDYEVKLGRYKTAWRRYHKI
jgi:hypothetical protein